MIQLDHDTTLGHFLIRKPGATFVSGNGLEGGIFGLDGSYELNPGILPVDAHGVPIVKGSDNNHDGIFDHLMRVYGTGAIAGAPVPSSVIFGETDRAHPFDQGEKIIHMGYGMEGKSSGPTIWFMHGPGAGGDYACQVWLGNHGNLVLDHSKTSAANPDGISVGTTYVSHTKRLADGSHDSWIDSFIITGHSENEFIGEQTVKVRIKDDGRSLDFHPQHIHWHGNSPHDEIAKWVHNHVGSGDPDFPDYHQFSHDDFIF